MTSVISIFIPDDTPLVTNGGFKDCTFGIFHHQGKIYSAAALTQKKNKVDARCNALFQTEIANVRFLKETFSQSKHFAELIHIEDNTLFFIRYPLNASELLLQDQMFPDEFRKKVAFDIIAAVNFLHINGLLHRDIKPSNVLIDQEGQGRLCDHQFLCRQEHPAARQILGTFAYLSPDTILAASKYQTFRHFLTSVTENDIWQTGLTAQLVLAGQKYPWIENVKLIALNKATKSDFLALHDAVENFCRFGSINFLKLLSFDPEERPTLETALQQFDAEITKIMPK